MCENIEFIFKCRYRKIIVNRIGLIDGYDERRVRETLNQLLRDRKNEFRELAESTGIPLTTDDWEVIILKFCLDFENCLKIWTDKEEPNSIKNTKCMTIMREIAKGKKNISEVFHIQNIAYTICTEFHQTYKRIT
ncbi:hypothetical protein YTPLAS73_04460 [Nitrosarchaeum sp.]|nr:hypothetical protein YTPLAS73_04460 [Nitrosarchaeum sp.]